MWVGGDVYNTNIRINFNFLPGRGGVSSNLFSSSCGIKIAYKSVTKYH